MSTHSMEMTPERRLHCNKSFPISLERRVPNHTGKRTKFALERPWLACFENELTRGTLFWLRMGLITSGRECGRPARAANFRCNRRAVCRLNEIQHSSLQAGGRVRPRPTYRLANR